MHVLYMARGLGPQGSDLRRLAGTSRVNCVEVTREELDRRASSSKHQGVVLLASPVPESTLDEVLASSSILMASDGVEDPQNFGALLRVADAMGVSGLIATRRRSSPITPAVAKASAGALEHVPVVRVTNLRRSLDLVRAAGFWIIAADADGEMPLYSREVDRLWQDSALLVLGSEGRGVRSIIKKMADVVVRIPMSGQVASLNVTNAAAVILGSRARVRNTGS